MSTNSISELVRTLKQANDAYRAGNPIMSDGEYDALELQLAELDPTNEFLNHLDDDVKDGYLQERKLTIHMGSQQKALSLSDPSWGKYQRETGVNEVFYSDKIDGMSMELTYTNGLLVQAVTRGDGDTGVDVTSTVKMIPSVPSVLPVQLPKVVIRGEVCMYKASLDKINEILVNEGRKPMANTRNGTVGIVKSEKNRHLAPYLNFLAFDMLIPEV